MTNEGEKLENIDKGPPSQSIFMIFYGIYVVGNLEFRFGFC
jgi:hypothetical protein